MCEKCEEFQERVKNREDDLSNVARVVGNMADDLHEKKYGIEANLLHAVSKCMEVLADPSIEALETAVLLMKTSAEKMEGLLSEVRMEKAFRDSILGFLKSISGFALPVPAALARKLAEAGLISDVGEGPGPGMDLEGLEGLQSIFNSIKDPNTKH